MSYRPPDWHKRLRELERRTDNQRTDITRLWNWAQQSPEIPGLATPMIPPVTTTPAPTTSTTSTSTTSTSTTGTSTTSTTTTPYPMTCRSTWPKIAGISPSGFTGDYFWMNPHPGYQGANGYEALDEFYNCGYSGSGPHGAGVYAEYQGPVFTMPGVSLTIRYRLRVELWASGGINYGANGWWQAGSNTFDYRKYSLRIMQTFSSVTYEFETTSPISTAADFAGSTESLAMVFIGNDFTAWPSSIPIGFSGDVYA